MKYGDLVTISTPIVFNETRLVPIDNKIAENTWYAGLLVDIEYVVPVKEGGTSGMLICRRYRNSNKAADSYVTIRIGWEGHYDFMILDDTYCLEDIEKDLDILTEKIKLKEL